MREAYLNQPFDPLLDIQSVRLETLRQQRYNLIHKLVVRHMLPRLHNAHDTSLVVYLSTKRIKAIEIRTLTSV